MAGAFVSDEEQFKKSVDERLAALDLNCDGVLSGSALHEAFESRTLIESHFGVDFAIMPQELNRLIDSILDRVDCDGSGTVNLEEFRWEMREIMLTIPDGLEACPIQMVLEEDERSFLKRAVDLEPVNLGGFHPVPFGTGPG